MGGIASKGQLRVSFLRWAVFTVPLILLLGFASGRAVPAGADNGWYIALQKPALTPPGWVFPVAWTSLYILLGLAWAASVGYGTFISLTSGDWVVATLACLSAAAMVGGISFRNFGAPRLAGAMIVLTLGSCCLAAPFTFIWML